jgi:hypothetical protein
MRPKQKEAAPFKATSFAKSKGAVAMWRNQTVIAQT